jgi:hypothetical protein
VTALLEPVAVWQWIARRRAAARFVPMLITIAVLGGLVVAVATEIGVRVFNTEWNTVAGYTSQPNRTWEPWLMLWAVAAALPVVQGLAGGALLPLYGRPRDWTGGLAVGVVGSLPVYLAAPALVMLPGILLACVAFLVSCAWWGCGARLLLGVPLGESSDHVVASVIAGSLLLSVALAVTPFA